MVSSESLFGLDASPARCAWAEPRREHAAWGSDALPSSTQATLFSLVRWSWQRNPSVGNLPSREAAPVWSRSSAEETPSLPSQGISGKLTRRGVCFCLSTAYEGTYLGSYHLDLLVKPQVQIHRHSVPIFIPLEHIAKQYLQTDIRRFLVVLSDHLNAYTARRYQAEQLQVPVTTAAPSFSLPSVMSLRSAGWNLSSFPCVALTLRVLSAGLSLPRARAALCPALGLPGWCGGRVPALGQLPALHWWTPVMFQELSLSLQERFSDWIEGAVQSNSLCNLLVFKYNVSSESKTFPFSVRLLYSDLCSSLPTEVTVSCARKWMVWGGWTVVGFPGTPCPTRTGWPGSFGAF